MPSDERLMEATICRLRYIVAAMVCVMTVLLEPARPLAVFALAAGPLVVNLYVHRTLRRPLEPADARRLAHTSLAADVACGAAMYLMLVGDSNMLPIVFMPLIVFELTIRFSGRGLAWGLGLFVMALVVHIKLQRDAVEGIGIRPPLLIAWVTILAMMVVLALVLRAREEARKADLEELERIAGSFRITVGKVLTQFGIAAESATQEDVLAAVRRICEQNNSSGECELLAAAIADLVAPGGRQLGLAPRERQILGLFARGHSYDSIASLLVVSPSTVRNYMHRIRSKLGVSSREEVVQVARAHGLGQS